MLALMTKMSLTQVSTWFANARRRLKKDNKGCRTCWASPPSQRQPAADWSEDDGVVMATSAPIRSDVVGHDDSDVVVNEGKIPYQSAVTSQDLCIGTLEVSLNDMHSRIYFYLICTKPIFGHVAWYILISHFMYNDQRGFSEDFVL